MQLDKKVFVYRNLRKNCFSIKDWTDKKVKKHSNFIVLNNCKFKVSEKGRIRVLLKKQKNVHAGILGNIGNEDCLDLIGNSWYEIYYNPYLTNKFIVKNTGEVVDTANCVILANNKIFAFGLNRS